MENASPDSSGSDKRPVFHKIPGAHSIKTRILVFTLVATIIPALTLGSLSYLQTTRFLNEKIDQGLRDIASQSAREFDLWIKERLYDMRVFSSSYVVSENLATVLRDHGARLETLVAENRLREYLRSVRQKFTDYRELMIVDLGGNLLATSLSNGAPPNLPPDWQDRVRMKQPVVGKVHFDPLLKEHVMLIADPILAADNQLLGVLGAKLAAAAVDQVLADQVQTDIDDLLMIDRHGRLMASSRQSARTASAARMETVPSGRLFAHPSDPITYTAPGGSTVIGTLQIVPTLGWGIVAETNRQKAFARVDRLQQLTLVIVAGLLAGLGLGAYFLGLTIVRPLRRLSEGAAQVATGNLDIDLPVRTRSEVGFLTQVFNHMVARLRRSREELDSVNQTLQEKNKALHQLSITDDLTGLYNRKHLMETLSGEVIRSGRHQHPFTLLMIDIDHFKRVNDTHGHPQGDEVLRRLAAVFRETIRDCDYVARYGGEEFIVLLTEIEPHTSMVAAERIRRRSAQESILSGDASINVTVSIGAAFFPGDGDTPQKLIQAADRALYDAKETGRNQIKKAAGRRTAVRRSGPIRLIEKS
ncbi:MAG: diguanylate cyclase [Desulfobacterales bacterium]